MRALVVTPDFPPAPGGIQLVMHRLVSNLRETEPLVVTLGFAGSEDEPADSFAVVRAGTKGATANKLAVGKLNAAAVWKAARFRPAVVVSGHVVAIPACATIRRLGGVPLIQYVHAEEFRTRPALTRLALREADAVVAVSRYAKQMALRTGARADRVHVIHLGVDRRPTPRGERERRPTILTVARMHERYKGHDTVIRALPLIRERFPDVQWVVIGDGRLRRWLEELSRAEGVADCVRFLGAVAEHDRDRWFARAHVFAMPSRLPDGGVGGEGFGIAFLEAASHGLPVVAGAVGGALDAVVDGETGLLVDPGDDRAVADAVVSLLVDRERAAALGARGRSRAEGFTWDRHARSVERLMAEVSRR